MHRFTCGPTRRDYVLNYQNGFIFTQGETATQSHDPILAFSENCPHSYSSRNLMRDNHSAQGGRRHDRGLQRSQFCRKLRAELLGKWRVLKHKRALNIPIAMQTGGENEMPFQQG
jgi:hypothetical protein